MSWILDNIYIIAVIGFFIISALGRRGKNPEERNPRMPSFGGEGERPARPAQGHQGQRGSQRPEARRVQSPRVSRPAPVQESTRVDRMDEEETESGNGYSLEHQELNRMKREQELEHQPDGMDHRVRMMESDLNRIHSDLDRMTVALPETVVEIHEEEREQRNNDRSVFAEEARNGIVWAEILGPPRSKRPMNPRR